VLSEGGVLSYVSHIGKCCPIGYFAPFWSETGIHFVHFGLESGMVIEGTTECYINVLIVSIPNE